MSIVVYTGAQSNTTKLYDENVSTSSDGCRRDVHRSDHGARYNYRKAWESPESETLILGKAPVLALEYHRGETEAISSHTAPVQEVTSDSLWSLFLPEELLAYHKIDVGGFSRPARRKRVKQLCDQVAARLGIERYGNNLGYHLQQATAFALHRNQI